MKEELKWIDTYLLQKDSEADKSFKKDSPLAQLKALESVSKVNGLYGVSSNNSLIPETMAVKADSIAIGVFSIKQGQEFTRQRTREIDYWCRWEYPCTCG